MPINNTSSPRKCDHFLLIAQQIIDSYTAKEGESDVKISRLAETTIKSVALVLDTITVPGRYAIREANTLFNKCFNRCKRI